MIAIVFSVGLASFLLGWVLAKAWPEIRFWLKSLAVRRNPRAKILREAVVALYLGGGTRTYTGALWQIVNAIDPGLARLVSEDPQRAAYLVAPELNED